MILDKIVESTKKRLEKSMQEISLDDMKEKAFEKKKQDDENGIEEFRFEKALHNKPIAFICEVKKASPSKGLIAKDFDYVNIAKEYEKAGASCISCLTEPEFFLGKNQYLTEISKEVTIPIIRKDFTIDEYMIYEAKVIGASAVLLIVAILTKEQIKEYIKIADSLGMSSVVEAHDDNEVLIAKECGARIIGVNNRNLKDFTVDINNSLRYRNMVSKDVAFVSESGITTSLDIKKLVDNDVNAVLIGETLMRSSDKEKMIKDLLDF